MPDRCCASSEIDTGPLATRARAYRCLTMTRGASPLPHRTPRPNGNTPAFAPLAAGVLTVVVSNTVPQAM